MEFDFFDISPEISEKTAVYPGDKAFSRDVSLDTKAGQHLTLSSIQSTVHIGAHTDAPNHYHKDGVGISERSLGYYYGSCQVIKVDKKPGERIYPEDIKLEIKAPRVLFRTDSFSDPNQWKEDFNSLSPELVQFLAEKKVKLVGIDTPSVDPADSKDLESHKAIYENNMAILEGIILTEVPDGVYKLVALPLKIKEADASPVRAILIKDGL